MAEPASTAPRTDSALHRPSPLACTECRRKHVKCDAGLPLCTRCATSGLQCNYMPSRRGFRRPEKRRADFEQPAGRSLSNPFDASCETSTQPPEWSIPTSSTFLATSPAGNDGVDASIGHLAPFTPTASAADKRPRSPPSTQQDASLHTDDEQLVNLYYVNFHCAHPILVPRNLYLSHAYPSYLRLVVQFIGSHYSSSLSSDMLRELTSRGLADETRKTPAMVQALLLYSIALHSRNEVEEAKSRLARAVDLAIELRMNRNDFASLHGNQQAIVEESLRRTWWELYVTDGYMAAVHRKSSFRINAIEADVLLPCDESVYADGACSRDPPSVAHFDARFFADEEMEFSSFCYRIEAVRIIARVLAITGPQDVHRDQVQAVDNALAAWAHHLPPAKADIINSYGDVDEMLFQAYMIIQYASILLHFPRSDLVSIIPTSTDVPCTQSSKHVSPASTLHTHAIKATEASKQLSNLAALRIPTLKHTPFFICCLALSAIVQLSACSVHSCRCLEQHRDRVTLILGVLRSLSQTWSLSQIILRSLKKLSAGVFQRGSEQPIASLDSGIDVSVAADDNTWLGVLDAHGLQGLMQFDADIFCGGREPLNG